MKNKRNTLRVTSRTLVKMGDIFQSPGGTSHRMSVHNPPFYGNGNMHSDIHFTPRHPHPHGAAGNMYGAGPSVAHHHATPGGHSPSGGGRGGVLRNHITGKRYGKKSKKATSSGEGSGIEKFENASNPTSGNSPIGQGGISEAVYILGLGISGYFLAKFIEKFASREMYGGRELTWDAFAMYGVGIGALTYFAGHYA